MSLLTEPTTLVLRKTWQPMDPDAAAYITAVEAADLAAGQSGGLEEKTKIAIDNFVLGCKQDGIWNAIKASCILAGARTTNGALVPLVGTAPTPFNFDLVNNTDYDRKTGLVGDGSSKYLNSNRAVNADPQNSTHLSAYISSFSTGGSATYLGAHSSDGAIFSFIRNDSGGGNLQITCNSNGGIIARSRSLGFAAVSRNSSSSITSRIGFQNVGAAATSGAISSNIYVFADNYPSPTPRLYSNARLAFYSIGESLDLAMLDARVTDLINAIGAAF